MHGQPRERGRREGEGERGREGMYTLHPAIATPTSMLSSICCVLRPRALWQAPGLQKHPVRSCMLYTQASLWTWGRERERERERERGGGGGREGEGGRVGERERERRERERREREREKSIICIASLPHYSL